MAHKIALMPCAKCGGDNLFFDKCVSRIRCKDCRNKSGLITPWVNKGYTETEAAAASWNAEQKRILKENNEQTKDIDARGGG